MSVNKMQSFNQPAHSVDIDWLGVSTQKGPPNKCLEPLKGYAALLWRCQIQPVYSLTWNVSDWFSDTFFSQRVFALLLKGIILLKCTVDGSCGLKQPLASLSSVIKHIKTNAQAASQRLFYGYTDSTHLYKDMSHFAAFNHIWNSINTSCQLGKTLASQPPSDDFNEAIGSTLWSLISLKFLNTASTAPTLLLFLAVQGKTI